jgi:D-methionine transport system ATP-binding protein
VALARVLLNEPEVLLLDEPTSGMDPGLANQILRLISRLRDRLHLTVIIVTHYPRLIRDQVTKVLFLNKGKRMDYGGPELLVKASSEELKRFLEEEA